MIISESGMYSLIFSSRLPEAKKFKRWVTSEVLPSIRKYGGYLITNPGETPEDIAERLKNVWESTVKRLEEENCILQYRVDKGLKMYGDRLKDIELLNGKINEQNEDIIFLNGRIQTGLTKYNEQKTKIEYLDKRVKDAEDWYRKNENKWFLVDKITNSHEDINIGEVAKVLDLGFGRNTLYKKLREGGFFFKDRNEPKQEFISKGYFNLKKVYIKNTNSTALQVFVPQKGVEFINKIFGK